MNARIPGTVRIPNILKNVQISVLVSLFLLLSAAGQAHAAIELLDSGTFGSLDFKVTFDDSGSDFTTLTITGNGAIPDCTPSSIGSSAPWVHSIEEVSDNLYRIGSLSLGKGITRIGNYAFYSPSAATILSIWSQLTIPDTVVSIGAEAFSGSYFDMTLSEGKVVIPDSVVSIGNGAFEPEVTIVCSTNSAAHKYALANGNSVELTDAPKETSDDASKQTPASAPKQYQIKYVLNKGTNHPSNPASYTEGKNVKLKAPSRKKYKFSGWYTDAAFKNKVTGALGDDNYTVYAKWTKVKVARVAAPVLKSPSKARLKITYKAVSKAKGYQIQYSLKKSFSGAKSKVLTKRALSLKLKSKKTYYVRVRAYKIDSAGKKVWGTWSKVRKIKLK